MKLYQDAGITDNTAFIWQKVARVPKGAGRPSPDKEIIGLGSLTQFQETLEQAGSTREVGR